MRVLVTGGAGYIGSHAARALRDAGHEVRVLDDLSRGHRAALLPEATFLFGDVADPGQVGRALDGVDAVLHFAGLLSVAESMTDPASYYHTNVVKGLALLDAAVSRRVPRIVFSSTCATYGLPVRVPMDEDHPQDPINPYGGSKRAFERALFDYAQAGKIRAVALRYFNAAGCQSDGTLGEDHRPEEHLIPLAVDAALGRGKGLVLHGDDYDTPDGTCIRDYIHVEDLARAHLDALSITEGPAFQAFNVGSGRGHSVREVVQSVERVSGQPVPARVGPRRPGDPPRLVAAADRLRAATGFAAKWLDLDAIVETVVRWRRDHPDGYGRRG